MNVLFYWLSTTSSLLHLLRDEPDAPSNNDRDPIIGIQINFLISSTNCIADGIYQPQKQPPQGDFQSRLEWLCFSIFKRLVKVICDVF